MSETFETAYKRLVAETANGGLGVFMSATGSGKSTIVPAYLASLNKKTFVVEPTIVNCRNLHQWVRNFVKDKMVGSSAGGKKLFVNSVLNPVSVLDIPVPDDLVVYSTSGYLRNAMRKTTQRFCDYILLDEYHVGTVDYDEIFMIWNHLWKSKGISLIIMTATIDPTILVEKYNAVVVRNNVPLPGASSERKNVRIEYIPGSGGSVYKRVAALVKEDLEFFREKKKSGLDLFNGQAWLVFCAGSAEVDGVVEDLKSEAELDVIGLYSKMEGLGAEGVTGKGKRGSIRVIVATNIVETGVTLPALTRIYDTLSEKVMIGVGKEGETAIITQQISKSAAIQRAGRLGRVEGSAGICKRLISEEAFDKLKPFSTRDISTLPIHRTIGCLFTETPSITMEDLVRISDRVDIEYQIAQMIEWGILTPNRKLTDLGKFCMNAPSELSIKTACLIYSLQGLSTKTAIGLPLLLQMIDSMVKTSDQKRTLMMGTSPDIMTGLYALVSSILNGDKIPGLRGVKRFNGIVRELSVKTGRERPGEKDLFLQAFARLNPSRVNGKKLGLIGYWGSNGTVFKTTEWVPLTTMIVTPPTIRTESSKYGMSFSFIKDGMIQTITM